MTETIRSARELIRAYMRADIPVFMIGPPGVGKSDLFRQVAAEERIGFIDLRLSQMDPVDLRGLPSVFKGTTMWNQPDFWPNAERDGPKGVILFDELADASKSMQSAAYQIILDRRAGPHVLLPGWYPAAAGNRREDRAAAQSISTALASRFAWIEVAADVEVFREYAIKKGLSHWLVGFLKMRPNLIHNMEGSDLRAFPCPRQWERVSRICDAPEEYRLKLVSGLVGDKAAGEFESFMRTVTEVPDLEDIIKDPKRCPIPKQPGAKYATSAMLARYADRKNLKQVAEYISREEFGREFEICTMLDATKRDAMLCETTAFINFANRNQDLNL